MDGCQMTLCPSLSVLWFRDMWTRVSHCPVSSFSVHNGSRRGKQNREFRYHLCDTHLCLPGISSMFTIFRKKQLNWSYKHGRMMDLIERVDVISFVHGWCIVDVELDQSCFPKNEPLWDRCSPLDSKSRRSMRNMPFFATTTDSRGEGMKCWSGNHALTTSTVTIITTVLGNNK